MTPREDLKAQLEQRLLDAWQRSEAEPGQVGTAKNVYFVVERAVDVLMPVVVTAIAAAEGRERALREQIGKLPNPLRAWPQPGNVADGEQCIWCKATWANWKVDHPDNGCLYLLRPDAPPRQDGSKRGHEGSGEG